MSEKHKRHLIFNINKFQVRILLPMLLSALIILSFLSLIYYLSISKTSTILESSKGTTIVYDYSLGYLGSIETFFPFLTVIMSIIVVILIFWTYRISNRLVGPYERIIKEIDEILEGKRENITPLRKGDEMFEKLLNRINILIEMLKKNHII
ncbi:MAG: hypothetical protein HQK78_14030 [Desulfobacterales bacterium]|nr:hypothetical protein [Desulfobacterales bacterium]